MTPLLKPLLMPQFFALCAQAFDGWLRQECSDFFVLVLCICLVITHGNTVNFKRRFSHILVILLVYPGKSLDAF